MTYDVYVITTVIALAFTLLFSNNKKDLATVAVDRAIDYKRDVAGRFAKKKSKKETKFNKEGRLVKVSEGKWVRVYD